MPSLYSAHPRALIRAALVEVLKAHPATAALLSGRVYPNRMEHWLADELPACGVYTLAEQTIDSDRNPPPDERRLSLVVEGLARMSRKVDDALDALGLALEQALQLDAIGLAMGALVDGARAAQGLEPLAPVLVDGQLRHPADTLLLLRLSDTELGIAVEGDREIGVAALKFDLEYTFPPALPGNLADFLLACADWDTEPADGDIDLQSRVEFPAPQPAADAAEEETKA